MQGIAEAEFPHLPLVYTHNSEEMQTKIQIECLYGVTGLTLYLVETFRKYKNICFFCKIILRKDVIFNRMSILAPRITMCKLERVSKWREGCMCVCMCVFVCMSPCVFSHF